MCIVCLCVFGDIDIYLLLCVSTATDQFQTNILFQMYNYSSILCSHSLIVATEI